MSSHLSAVLSAWWSRLLYAWRFAVFVCQGTVVAVVDLFVLGTQTDGHRYVANIEGPSSCPANRKCAVTFHPASTRCSRFAYSDASFVVHREAISAWVSSTAAGAAKPLAVVTGGSVGGIGWSTAAHLMLAGVDVIVVCSPSCAVRGGALRVEATLKAAVASQRRLSVDCGSVRVMVADVGDVKAMMRLAAELVETQPTLRVVVCSAGYMAPPPGLTVDGFETQMGTHVVGHGAFLLTLLDCWKRRLAVTAKLPGDAQPPPLRVVIVSSAAAVGGRIPPCGLPRYRTVKDLVTGTLVQGSGVAAPYDRFQGYRDAKLCGAAMGAALAKRVADDAVLRASVTVNALHPGPIWSNVVPNSQLELQWLLDWSVSSSIFRMSPHASGLFVADLCLHREYDHVSGHYFRMGVDMTRRYQKKGTMNADSLWSPGTPSPHESMDEKKAEALVRYVENIRKELESTYSDVGRKGGRQQSPRRRR